MQTNEDNAALPDDSNGSAGYAVQEPVDEQGWIDIVDEIARRHLNGSQCEHDEKGWYSVSSGG